MPADSSKLKKQWFFCCFCFVFQMFRCKNIRWRLQTKWKKEKGSVRASGKAQVWFPASRRQLSNFSSRGSYVLFWPLWVPDPPTHIKVKGRLKNCLGGAERRLSGYKDLLVSPATWVWSLGLTGFWKQVPKAVLWPPHLGLMCTHPTYICAQ